MDYRDVLERECSGFKGSSDDDMMRGLEDDIRKLKSNVPVHWRT